MINILLGVILTIQQILDVVSTSLVITKGRGSEANPLMARWMSFSGKYWPVIKLPVVGITGYLIWSGGSSRFVTAFLVLSIAVYSWVIYNNYKIAWRKN